MPRPKGSKNKPKDFKERAEKQVVAKQQSHIENGVEPIVAASGLRILELAINDIRENPYQPRRVFDDEALKELAGSIKNHGLLNPVLVQKDEDGYFLVGGERRLRACRQLGMDTIRAVIVEADAEIASLIDNIQREDLHPFERALAVNRLHEKYGRDTSKVSEMISVSERSVQRLLSLTRLTERIDAADTMEAEAKLTDNSIPLREFVQLTRYSDNTQLNARFNELAKKYGKDPKTDPIELRRKEKLDEMDKALGYAKKIKQELETLGVGKGDTRLTELGDIIKEITQLIKNLKTG